MNRNYHLLHDGTLSRDENTIRFDRADGNTNRIPVRKAEALFCYGQNDYNTELLELLDEHGVELHVFGWNDQYLGTHAPSRQQMSGETLVEQVRAYDDSSRRVEIASEMVRGSLHNMRRNIEYYLSRGEVLEQERNSIRQQIDEVDRVADVSELLGVEATGRRAYYSAFDEILSEFDFDSRSYNPPNSRVNALISFCNSLVYANITSAIHQTALEPTVSYLHEPGDRRNSLSLDIADVFKPVIADRVLFRVVNRGQVTADDFRDDVDSYLLNEGGRKTVLKEYEELLRETVEHPKLERKVSYKYLLRLEAYKLKKSLLGGEQYEAFRRWW